MLEVVAILLIGTMIGLIVWSTRSYRKTSSVEFPYKRRRYLCDRNERNFFRYLVRTVSQDYLILTKVRLADIIALDDSLLGRQKLEAYEKIISRKASFVLVDRATTEIRMVIELFDERMSSAKRVQQAIFVDKLFAEVQIPLVRVRISETYHINELRRAILDAESKYENQAGSASFTGYGDMEARKRALSSSRDRRPPRRSAPSRIRANQTGALETEKALPNALAAGEENSMERLPSSALSVRPSRINVG